MSWIAPPLGRPPASSTHPTIWCASTSRAWRCTRSGSRLRALAASIAATVSPLSSLETGPPTPLDTRRGAGGGLRGDVQVPRGFEVLVVRLRPLHAELHRLLHRRLEDLERTGATEEACDDRRVANGRRQADPLEGLGREFPQPLERDHQLHAPTVPDA